MNRSASLISDSNPDDSYGNVDLNIDLRYPACNMNDKGRHRRNFGYN